MSGFVDNLEKIDLLIRKGRIKEARQALLSVKNETMERKFRRPFADLARRCDLNMLSLYFLRPIIRSDTPVTPEPSGLEKASYAATLIRIGATLEGLKILSEIDSNEVPDVGLYQAFAYFSQWNYQIAIPGLKRFINSKKITEYRRLIGKVNLAAALITTQNIVESETLLEELFDSAKVEAQEFILGTILELKAQLAYQKRDFQLGRDLLVDARKILQQESPSLLYVEKWTLILQLAEKPNQVDLHQKMDFLKGQSEKWDLYESIRDIDFYKSLFTQNDDLFRHVYIGTPFPDYRRKMLELYPGQFREPSTHSWMLGATTQPELKVNVVIENEILRKFFAIVSSDFYRPIPLGGIFYQLYPNEHFDPITSPNRVAKTVSRMRKLWQEQKIPLSIGTKGHSFRLISTTPCLVLWQKTLMTRSNYDISLAQLKLHFSKRTFTRAQVCKALGVSPATAHRILQWHINNHKVFAFGRARSTRYSFGRKPRF